MLASASSTGLRLSLTLSVLFYRLAEGLPELHRADWLVGAGRWSYFLVERCGGVHTVRPKSRREASACGAKCSKSRQSYCMQCRLAWPDLASPPCHALATVRPTGRVRWPDGRTVWKVPW